MEKLGLSARAQSLQPSPTLALDAKAKRLIKDEQAKGIPEMEGTINLTAGEPDTNTPIGITNAIKNSLDKGQTKYVAAQGIIELRTALSEHIARTLGVTYSPNDIVVTAGAKQGLFTLAQVMIDPGDEVLIPTPSWVSYEEQVKQWGGAPVFVPPEKDFDLDFDGLRGAITKRTKAIIVNSPNNPTGKMYNRGQLVELASFAQKNNIFIVSDEMYSPFAFGQEHVSVPSLSDDARARTFLVHGFSKANAMTGLRLGYVAGPQPFMQAMADAQSQCIGNANSATQYGGVQALKEQQSLDTMVGEFRERRNFVTERLKNIPGITLAPPDGAFYAFIDVHQVEPDSTKFCDRLLDEEKVALVPGVAFHAEGWVRMSYAKSMETLKEALDRFERFVKNYKK